MGNTKLVSTTHFYDSIADAYDKFLSNPRDESVRREVSSFFRATVPGNAVMDFGGGTGLDLPWLLENRYKVYFCEPSVNMRRRAEEQARQYEETNMPVFLQQTDFVQWEGNHVPFDEKLSGILANFGVINYVSNLPLLFKTFHCLLHDHGSVVASVLYASPSKLLLKYFGNTIRAFARGEKVKTGSEYGGVRHETTLYSLKDIEYAAKKYFVLSSHKTLGGNSDFLLIHLTKK